MKKIHRLWSALALGLPVLLHGTTPSEFTVTHRTFEENPTGVAGTFFSESQSQKITELFGPRAYIREGFMYWNRIETGLNVVNGVETPVYDFSSSSNYGATVTRLKGVHRAGATPMTCVNIGFNALTAPYVDGVQKTTIPTHYANDITNPQTRAAALAFAEAFTKRLLTDLGEVILLVDYENCFNFRFNQGEPNRTIYKEWAIAVANRMAAAATEINARDRLRLAINFNGDLFQNADRQFGGLSGDAHVPQQWVEDSIEPYDIVSLDNYFVYQVSPATPNGPVSGDLMVDNIRFFIEKYCDGRPFFVMENGFSTVTEEVPGYVAPPGLAKKGHGTRADQATYFTDVLTQIAAFNGTGGDFLSSLRAFAIWKLQDEDPGTTAASDDFYGVIAEDGSEKPGFDAVKDAFALIDATPSYAPVRRKTSVPITTVTAEVTSVGDGQTTDVTTLDGAHYDELQMTFKMPSTYSSVILTVNYTTKGGLIVTNRALGLTRARVQAANGQFATTHSFDITDLVQPGFNKLRLRATAPIYPATIGVDRVNIDYVGQQVASLDLRQLEQSYDGTAKTVTVETNPAGVPFVVTYDGGAASPTFPGSYAVTATVADSGYEGATTSTLTIVSNAQVTRAPVFNGHVQGSVQVLTAENVTLNGAASVSGDLLLPGLPSVWLNGRPSFSGVIDGPGGGTPAGHAVTLNGRATLRHLVRKIEPTALPLVAAPTAPDGTRDVFLNYAGQPIGDFASVRDLTLNANAGHIAVPPGTYGAFNANSGTGFVLGVAGSTEPVNYDLQRLTLNHGSSLHVVSPVVVTLAQGAAFSGSAGSPDHPTWLTLRVADGGLTLNSHAAFHGALLAPEGAVAINSGARLHGRLLAEHLVVNAGGELHVN